MNSYTSFTFFTITLGPRVTD